MKPLFERFKEMIFREGGRRDSFFNGKPMEEETCETELNFNDDREDERQKMLEDMPIDEEIEPKNN